MMRVADRRQPAIRPPHFVPGCVNLDDAGAEKIGQIFTSALASRLLAAAEEPPTAQ
jgi:hypothetical protein